MTIWLTRLVTVAMSPIFSFNTLALKLLKMETGAKD